MNTGNLTTHASYNMPNIYPALQGNFQAQSPSPYAQQKIQVNLNQNIESAFQYLLAKTQNLTYDTQYVNVILNMQRDALYFTNYIIPTAVQLIYYQQVIVCNISQPVPQYKPIFDIIYNDIKNLFTLATSNDTNRYALLRHFLIDLRLPYQIFEPFFPNKQLFIETVQIIYNMHVQQTARNNLPRDEKSSSNGNKSAKAPLKLYRKYKVKRVCPNLNKISILADPLLTQRADKSTTGNHSQ